MGDSAWSPARLKVSQSDGAVLAIPALDDLPEVIERNHELLAAADCDVSGRSLSELRAQSRREIIARAVRFTSRLRQEEVAPPAFNRIICDGHQPLLFHTGVWAKNFVLSGLSQKVGAVPLHLIVDNDSLSSCEIAVPTGTLQSPLLQKMPFDAEHPSQPWEGATVLDQSLFRSFPQRVEEKMNGWGFTPLLDRCWSAAVEAMERGESLPFCLTAARHQQECEWGLDNLELPLSEVDETNVFRHFMFDLLSHLPCFRELYNQILAEYRQVNGIRSQTHPVPELKSRGEWLEAPFWVWHESRPERQPLFVKLSDDSLSLASNEQEFARLNLADDANTRTAVDQLNELYEQGYRLRSRALTTTLFARLFLSDLFIHGIGGAKYDEMTDRLIKRFYNFEPPAYLTLSGTWHLPIAGVPGVTEEDRHRLEHQLREIQYNPERILGPQFPEAAQKLISEKRTLIEEQQQVDVGVQLGENQREHHRRGLERYRRLRDINQALSECVEDKRREIQNELEAVEQQLRSVRLLRSREYSFCLFPAEKLKDALTSIVER